MITEFELSEKFQPFYKSGKPICVTSDGFIISDDGENINYINRANLENVGTFNERNEEVTCFVASETDYTVIIANRNLMLRKIDRSDRGSRQKIWHSNHSAPIFAMSLNRSSTRLATGGADHKVRIWHIGPGEGNSYSCVHHKSKINIVKNHPVANVVVSASLLDHEVAAWDTESGAKLGLFAGHQNVVTGIDFHPGCGQMITSSRDETLIIWDFNTFTKKVLIPTMEAVETCIVLEAFMNQPKKDDYLIMVGGVNGVMKTISPHKKSIIQEFKKASLFANVSVDDSKKEKSGLKTIRLIMKVDESIVVVRESDNIEFYSNTMQLEYELAGDLSGISDVLMVGKDKDMLLVVESAPYMRLFSCKSFLDSATKSTTDRESKSTQWPCHLISGGHTKDITSVSAFSDGLKVASGGKDGKVCIWEVKTDDRLKLQLVASIDNPDNIVRFLCVDGKGETIYVNYSKDDSLVALSLKGNSLTRVCLVSKPHGDIISSMDVNVNSSLLATGSKDKCAKIWSFIPKAKEIVAMGTLKGHKRGLWSVRFSELEQVLLTASMDQSIKIWSIGDFSCISTLASEFVIYKALFHRNEKQIITCDQHGSVNVWNREKRCLDKNFIVHDEPVDCLTLLPNGGFVAAGGSMICLYRDVSETHVASAKEARDTELQNQQELDNLLFQQQYSRALRLAVALDKPLAAFKILAKIQDSETPEAVAEMTPVKMSSTDTEIGRAVDELNGDELRTLFQFAAKWITNGKTFVIGERIVGIILCTVSNDELCLWPDFAKHIEALQSYSTRYYGRMTEDRDHMTFYNYLSDVSHTFHIADRAMDTS